MRKHFTQFSSDEKAAIANRLATIAARRAFVDHAAERMAKKQVTAREIEIALRYGNAIEVHTEAGEVRALIAHTFGKPKVKVNVVISLETGTVITTWKNAATDNHSTLDKSLYGWQMDITKLLANIREVGNA